MVRESNFPHDRFTRGLSNDRTFPQKRVTEALGVGERTVLEKSVEDADDLSSCHKGIGIRRGESLTELDFGIS